MSKSILLTFSLLVLILFSTTDAASQTQRQVNVFLDYEQFPARGTDVLLYAPSINSYDSLHVTNLSGSISAVFDVSKGSVDLHISIEDCDGAILMERVKIDSSSSPNQNIVIPYCNLRTACWDLDGDALCDPNEDLDNNSVCDSADCTLQCHPQFEIAQAGSLVSFMSTTASSSHTWTFSNGVNSTAASPVVSFVPGRHTACLEFAGPLSSCNGKYDKVCKSFAVLATKICGADFSFGTSFQGNLLYFNNNSSGGDGANRYLWNFGDGTTSSHSNPIKVFQSKSNFNVCLIQKSANCNDTICKNISIQNLGWQCDTGQISTYGFIDEEQFKVELRDTSNKFWLDPFWDFGNGQTLGGKSTAIVSYASPGNYDCCLKTYSPIEHCADSTCVKIEPPDTLDYCKSNFSFRNAGGLSFQFNNGSINVDPNFRYVWSFGDATTDTKENPLHTYPSWSQGRTVDVCLRISGIGLSLHECSDSECKKLLVTSLEEMQDGSSMRIYPNPNNGKLHIDLGQENTVFHTIEVLNSVGKVVFEQKMPNQTFFRLELPTLANGLYFLCIKNSKTAIRKSFILQK